MASDDEIIPLQERIEIVAVMKTFRKPMTPTSICSTSHAAEHVTFY